MTRHCQSCFVDVFGDSIVPELPAVPSDAATTGGLTRPRRRPVQPAPPLMQLRPNRKSRHYVQSDLTQEEETRKINFNRRLSAKTNIFSDRGERHRLLLFINNSDVC